MAVVGRREWRYTRSLPLTFEASVCMRDSPGDWPKRIEALERRLTRPTQALVEAITAVEGPLVVLGAGGKMGPTLAVLAQRAAQEAGHPLQVIAVSRFSSAAARTWLEAQGVATRRANLLERSELDSLPDASHVVYLVGRKFGTAEEPVQTWVTNTVVPTYVCERYSGTPITALSTGNVYPWTIATAGGSRESDSLGPLGEYAHAAVARERVFEFFARKNRTPMTLVRLNYAVELRYGVLVDIARKVFRGEPVDVTTGYLNCIWQGDANETILRSFSLAASPPAVINLTSEETLSVRQLAGRFGELLGREPHFVGEEAKMALLSNAAKCSETFGAPNTRLDQVIEWTAAWIRDGGPSLDQPTHFEVRDGGY